MGDLEFAEILGDSQIIVWVGTSEVEWEEGGQGMGGVVGRGAILVVVAHNLSYLDSCLGPVSSCSGSSSLKLCSSMCNVLESCVCGCGCVWVRACGLSLSINSLLLSTVLIALNRQQENGRSTPCPDQVNILFSRYECKS